MNYFFINILMAVCLFVNGFPYEYNTYYCLKDSSLSSIDADIFEGLNENKNNYDYANWKIDNFGFYHTSNHVFYKLYTRDNTTGQLLNRREPRMIESTTYNPNNPLKVIVHGWLGTTSEKDGICAYNYKSYFKVGDYNVLCVDWKQNSIDFSYVIAKMRAKHIGNDIANVLKRITNNMTEGVENIHLIGHSMGAHIVGFVGKILINQIPRVTGLDPARPLYENSSPENRLDKTDANFVDIIHTNGDKNGILKSIGHIDFFPNGGKRQPKCGRTDIATGSCSHIKSYHYFAQSIWAEENYIAEKCSNWLNYTNNLCYNESSTYMGEYVDQRQTGDYYLYAQEDGDE